MIEPNPPIYFIRHGETDWNREHRIQGQTDIPLNDTGHRQAESVARALKNHLGNATVDRYIVSPLTRTRQTMGYVAREFDVPESRAEIVPAVTELGFGIWEGKPFAAMKSHPSYPADLFQRYNWRPEDGESYADGYARLQQWIGRIEGPTVIVAHGAIGRCLIGLVSDLPPQQLLLAKTPQGCFCHLQHGHIDWFDVNGDAA